MICRVRQIRRGPLSQITQLLLSYKIGIDLFGSLWSAVQYIAWNGQSRRWRFNIILSAEEQREWTEPLDVALFVSWWEQWLPRWLKCERAFEKAQKAKENVEEAPSIKK